MGCFPTKQSKFQCENFFADVFNSCKLRGINFSKIHEVYNTMKKMCKVNGIGTPKGNVFRCIRSLIISENGDARKRTTFKDFHHILFDSKDTVPLKIDPDRFLYTYVLSIVRADESDEPRSHTLASIFKECGIEETEGGLFTFLETYLSINLLEFTRLIYNLCATLKDVKVGNYNINQQFLNEIKSVEAMFTTDNFNSYFGFIKSEYQEKINEAEMTLVTFVKLNQEFPYLFDVLALRKSFLEFVEMKNKRQNAY